MVSNQGVVGRGVIGEDVAWDIQRRVVAEIETHGGRIDASYLCPHHPDAGCTCRKPAPGMLLRAAGDLELDLRQSWLIGDALTDIEAAAAVGARGILVRTGRGASQASLLIPRDGLQYTVVDDLAEAAARIAEDQPAFCDSGFRGPST
jgi:HAD superfamily hydrolase (TIGR01662 family)